MNKELITKTAKLIREAMASDAGNNEETITGILERFAEETMQRWLTSGNPYDSPTKSRAAHASEQGAEQEAITDADNLRLIAERQGLQITDDVEMAWREYLSQRPTPATASENGVKIGSKDTKAGTWQTGLNPHGDSIQGFADKIIDAHASEPKVSPIGKQCYPGILHAQDMYGNCLICKPAHATPATHERSDAGRASEQVNNYVGITLIIENASSQFADTIHADDIDHVIRKSVIEAYELGKMSQRTPATVSEQGAPYAIRRCRNRACGYEGPADNRPGLTGCCPYCAWVMGEAVLSQRPNPATDDK